MVPAAGVLSEKLRAGEPASSSRASGGLGFWGIGIGAEPFLEKLHYAFVPLLGR